MADNFVSYNRFTALPQNIADYGSTVEEVQLQRGKPAANPVLSPMPTPRASVQRLFLKPRGSDQMRVSEPTEPDFDPYVGALSVLSLSRKALRKLGSSVLSELEDEVQSSSSADDETVGLMSDSFSRVTRMRQALSNLTKMAEHVYVRSVAGSRG